MIVPLKELMDRPGSLVAFAGSHYYPCGGAGDCMGCFETRDDILAFLATHAYGQPDWVYVLDTRSKTWASYDTINHEWESEDEMSVILRGKEVLT